MIFAASAPQPVPPLPAHQLLVFLLQLLTLLLLAFVLGRAAERVRMPAIVGELLAGVILGPSLLGTLWPSLSGWLLPAKVDQMHLLDAAGQLGVLLLVGVTGSHLDLVMLKKRSFTAARISLAGLLVPLGLGLGLGFLVPASLLQGDRRVFALFLGVALCVTAIPVIAKTLSDLNILHRDVAQLILAAGLVDDAVAWFLLSLVSALATVGVSTGHVSLSLVYLVGFSVFAFLVGRPLVRRLMTLADRSNHPGPTIAMSTIIVLAGAGITQSLGMEAMFGAFIAGMLVGAPGAANHLKLAPLRAVVLSVLAPLFLATAGLRMDLTTLAHGGTALAALAILAVAIFGKFAGAYLGARLSKLSRWEGLAIGAGMNARGVVEVVIAMVGLRVGVLNTTTYTSIVLVAIVTSLMAPPLLRIAMARVDQSEDERKRLAEHESWVPPMTRSKPEPEKGEAEMLRPATA